MKTILSQIRKPDILPQAQLELSTAGQGLAAVGDPTVDPVTLLPRLSIAHIYQEGGIRFSEPQAAQLHMYHTILGLQQAGHTVALLALQRRQVLYTQDLEVFRNSSLRSDHYGRLELSGTSWFKLFESVVRRVQSELRLPYLALFDSYRMAEAGHKNLTGFDLIHERFNLLSLGGVWASRRLGIPLVLEVNADLLEQRKFKGVPERGLRRLFAVWATRTCFNTATKIICISEGLKEHVKSKWNIDERKLTVLPCAADVQAFGAKHDTEAIRQSLGLTTEPVVIWVGGFYPWHDLDLLLESFARVFHKNPRARLVLVGDGPTRPSVERRVLQNDLSQAVILAGGVAHSRVPELLSIADIAVVPSAPISASSGGTGTPLKLFEYMAAGKAIIATALNESAELIQDGQNGVLVEAGDVNRFTEAILTLLNDPVERLRLGQHARQQAVELYSWERYTRKLEEIYHDVLGNVTSMFPEAYTS